jgi:hypothetical protein
VRLEQEDDWREAISALPDLPAELEATDDPGASSAGSSPGNPGHDEERGSRDDRRREAVRVRLRRTRSGVAGVDAAAPAQERFTGSADRLLGRILARALPWVQAGVVFEKDPGEEPENGFASGFLRLAPAANGVEIIAGDFRMRGGSGILFGASSFAPRAGGMFPPAGDGEGPVRPHTSSDESRFFRGLAVRVPLSTGPWGVDAAIFCSSVARNGRLDAAGVFLPDLTGLARTADEVERVGRNRETLVGSIVSGRHAGLHLQVVGYHARLAHPIVAQSGGFEARRTWTAGSATVSVRGARFDMTSDVAFSRRAAVSVETRASPSRHITWTIRYQRVWPGLLSPYGVDATGRPAEGDVSDCGFTCEVRPARWGILSVSASVLTSSRPKENDPLPPWRVRSCVHADVRLTPGWSLQLFGGVTRSAAGASQEDAAGRRLRTMREDERSTLRLRSHFDPGGAWSVRTRVEIVKARHGVGGPLERGLLVQTDLAVRPLPSMRAAARASLFNVSSWGARVYSPEDDVEGAARFPAFTGRGVRMYALLRWSLTREAAVSCRYGVTLQETVPRTPATELDARAPTRDLSLQMDLAW